MMDDLMVSFSRGQNYHYNHYFDTEDDSLFKRHITLRCRVIIDGDAKKNIFTLKIPSGEFETFVEYHQTLSDEAMQKLVYQNILPDGEIKDLTAIHGGHVIKKQLIWVSRVLAPYQSLTLFFDKINVQGQTYYEMGTRLEALPQADLMGPKEQFYQFLKSFNQIYHPAKRRSYRFLSTNN
jgi:uncharacterized protein YjbK